MIRSVVVNQRSQRLSLTKLYNTPKLLSIVDIYIFCCARISLSVIIGRKAIEDENEAKP